MKADAMAWLAFDPWRHGTSCFIMPMVGNYYGVLLLLLLLHTAVSQGFGVSSIHSSLLEGSPCELMVRALVPAQRMVQSCAAECLPPLLGSR